MKFLSRFTRKKPEETNQTPAPKQQAPFSAAKPEPARPGKKPAANPDELRLELGDFLQRIPAQFLSTEQHDEKAPLIFSISDLAQRLKNGATTIPLADIYKQLPGIFCGPLPESEPVEVRFPWKKVAQLVTPDGDAGAATDLLARIRERIPGRNVKTGPISEPDLPPEPAPILRGRRREQPSWFSKPTIDRGETAQRAPSIASSVAQTGDTMGADVSAKAETPSPVEATPDDASKERVRSALQGLVQQGQSQDLQRQIAVVQGEFERQLAIGERLRANVISENRDLRVTLEKLSERLDEELTATSATRELIRNTTSERDTIHQELAELRRQVAEGREQDKIGQLTAERDALLKQKAYLSAQIAEVANRRTGNLPGKPGDPTSSSPLGPQRQLEEYQRRISALEASQRETALELSREKEARAKAEKFLTAAERLQEESAKHMESSKLQMRKELEASLKPREVEFRKVQKELMDQNAVLSDQHRKAMVDLENVRHRLAELEPIAASAPHIRETEEKLAATIAQQRATEEELAKARAQIGALETFEGQATETRKLESEITALQEANEKTAVALQAAQARIGELEQFAKGDHLSSENAALRDFQRRTASELEKARSRIAELELQSAFAAQTGDLEQQVALLSEHNLTALSELEAARNKITALEAAGSAPAQDPMQAQALARLEEDNERYRSRLKTLIRERDSAATEVVAQRGKFDSQIAEERAASESRCETLRQALDAAREAAAAQIAAAIERGRVGVTSGDGALETQLDLFEQQVSLLSKERDDLRKSNEDLEARLKGERAEREQLLKAGEEEHEFTVRANKEMSERLVIAEKTKADLQAELTRIANDASASAGDTALQAELAALRTELAEARREHESAITMARAQSDSLHENETALTRLIHDQQVLAANLSEERAVLEDELETQRELVAGLTRNLEMAEHSLSGMQVAHTTTEAANSAEREKLIAAVAVATRERDRAIADRDAATAGLTRAKAESQQFVASLDGEREVILCARDEAERQVAAANLQIEQLRNAAGTFERDLAAAVARANDVELKLATATREIEQLRIAGGVFENGVAAANTRAAGLEQKLATAMREAEQLRVAASTFDGDLIAANARAIETEQKLAAAVRDADQLRATSGNLEGSLAAAKSRVSEFEQKLVSSEGDAREMRDRIARSGHEVDARNSDLSLARAATEAARKDAENLRAEIAALRKQLAELSAARAEAEGELNLLRGALQGEITHGVEEGARFTAARDQAVTQLSMERNARENVISTIRARHEEHERTLDEIARLRRELNRVTAERDEINRRVARFNPAAVREAESSHPVADNIIEVTEIIEPRVSNNLNIRPVRPVTVPPPKISSL